MDKIKVRFTKALYPYNEGDIGYLTPDRVEYNKDYVEVVKDEKPQNKMVTPEKAVKKSTK